jgi:hypothetical protein
MLFCSDIIGIICKYVPNYDFVEWIPREKIDALIFKLHNDCVDRTLSSLSKNPHPHAITLLNTNLKSIDWENLNINNPAIVTLLLSNPEKVYWHHLSKSSNPTVLKLLQINPEVIDWYDLSENSHPVAIDILKMHPNDIDWFTLVANSHPWAMEKLQSLNTDGKYNYRERLLNWSGISANSHPFAIKLLEANPDKIDWRTLAPNSSASHLMESNPLKACWDFMANPMFSLDISQIPLRRISFTGACMNPNPNKQIIELLKNNQEKINWVCMSANAYPFAVELLQKNPTKIDWCQIFKNPAIFKPIQNTKLFKILTCFRNKKIIN